MNASKVTLYALLETPIICLMPGFLTGVYLCKRICKEKQQEIVYNWNNKAARVAAGFALIGLVYLLRWAIKKINRDAIEAVLIGACSYFGGLLIAAVIPMLRPFPEVKPENAQPLVV